MAIYLLFIQHIIFSLSNNGKAAIVVPTGFLSAKDSISTKIRKALVESKSLSGIVTMPSNIFATTGTSVSIVFVDKSKVHSKALLVDASNLGKSVKDGKNQKTLLDTSDEDLIISTFNKKSELSKFSVLVTYKDIAEYGYSFNPGQFFEMTTDDIQLSPEKFREITLEMKSELASLLKDKATVDSLDILLANKNKRAENEEN